jgi:hypothetical protein
MKPSNIIDFLTLLKTTCKRVSQDFWRAIKKSAITQCDDAYSQKENHLRVKVFCIKSLKVCMTFVDAIQRVCIIADQISTREMEVLKIQRVNCFYEPTLIASLFVPISLLISLNIWIKNAGILLPALCFPHYL